MRVSGSRAYREVQRREREDGLRLEHDGGDGGGSRVPFDAEQERQQCKGKK
jgi:hypothetical protein